MNRDDGLDPTALRRIPLFQDVSDAALAALAARGTLHRFAPGAVLWLAGDEPRGLHVLLEGEVRVVRATDGRQHVIHTERAGGTLGEVPLFEGTRYPATAIASRRAVCAVFSREALLAAIETDAGLALALLGRLAARVREVIGRLEATRGRTVVQRLAGYLLSRRERAGQPVFTLGCTQLQLAEELGTVREVVVRGLRELKEAQVIESAGGGRIRVLDDRALAAIAAPPGEPVRP